MPRSTAVLAVEGVLKKPSGDAWITEGVNLYRSLCTSYHVILTVDLMSEEQSERWLYLNGLNSHEHVDYVPDGNKIEHPTGRLRKLRQDGYNIELVVLANPGAAQLLMMDGWPVLLFMHPFYARPEWRPHFARETAPWDAVRAIYESDAEAKGTDSRLAEE